MSKITTAKRVFMLINDQIDKAYDAPAPLKQSILLNLKTINEELADKVIDNLKKLEVYERQIGKLGTDN